MPIILSTRRKSQFNVFTFRNGQLISIVVVLFICSVDKKAYPLLNVQNSPLFYFAIFQIIHQGEHLEVLLSVCVSFLIVCPFLSYVFVWTIFIFWFVHVTFIFIVYPWFYCVHVSILSLSMLLFLFILYAWFYCVHVSMLHFF